MYMYMLQALPLPPSPPHWVVVGVVYSPSPAVVMAVVVAGGS